MLVAGLIWTALIALLQDYPKCGEPLPCHRGFTILSLADAFDPEYAILWETQVPALQLISRAGKGQASTNRLFFVWGEARRHYPEIFEGTTFDEWLAFLEDAQLIERQNGSVRITADGRALLEYRLHEKKFSLADLV
ncbi:MAG TPA: hypothetical protein VEG30_18555 [Terriglobales bacterium]|nr:hypothetical protein [Terriglobales bacterium]